MYHDRRAPNRPAPTWRQVLNPIWLASDIERNMAFWWINWFRINPFCNLMSVVLGISHRSRTVYVSAGDGWTYVDGWNRGWIKADESGLVLPFRSYRGRFLWWHIECMAGWHTSGRLGLTFRTANAQNPGPHP